MILVRPTRWGRTRQRRCSPQRWPRPTPSRPCEDLIAAIKNTDLSATLWATSRSTTTTAWSRRSTVREVVAREDGTLWNTVVPSSTIVSQFWTFDPEEFLAQPLYSTTGDRAREPSSACAGSSPALAAGDDGAALRLDGVTRMPSVASSRWTARASELPPGGRLAVIGPNWAGKTTLFRLIAGEHRPTAGRAHPFGEDAAQAQSERRRATPRHRTHLPGVEIGCSTA